MLIYFHKKKANYKKGQVAPFFILILVIIIMMALVTLNLSKVSLIKTDTSNAVDSGGLAASSAMANVFNAAAVSNSQMLTHYQGFYASVSVSFGIALASLATAMADACSRNPGSACAAVEKIAKAIKTTIGIMVTVEAYHIAQQFFYKQIKKITLQGRRQAMTIGHRFAFINSGISSKLKDGSPPEEITEEEKKNNYRKTFNDFLDDTIKEEDVQDCQDNIEYTYSWIDGQEREHSTRVIVDTQPVNRFEMRVTVLPLPAESGLLGAALGLGYSAKSSQETACEMTVCCPPQPDCDTCPAFEAACAEAIDKMADMIAALTAAWAGLLPGPTVLYASPCGGDNAMLILAWIVEIEHNRRVRADTWQTHQGADLGLWETRYPETYSWTRINFEGNGQIYEPKPNFDASIEATDQIGGR